METAFPLPRELRGAVAALGNFDGVHLGHQAVVGHAVELARSLGRPAIAVTFSPHPVRYFDRNRPAFLLTGVPERLHLLRACGVDEAIALPFDGAMAALPPREFIRRWLVETLGASVIVTGQDFHFGRARSGTLEILESEGARYGLTSEAVPIRNDGGQPVSSTRIRGLVRVGQLEEAACLLGRPFRLGGTMYRRTDGDLGLGSDDRLLPPRGRYRARVQAGQLCFGDVEVRIEQDQVRCILSDEGRARLMALTVGMPVTLALAHPHPDIDVVPMSLERTLRRLGSVEGPSMVGA
ncbi:hypothetical protein [Methylobacterium sp. C1]|uniref:hypothetical protein n=1 Tax=Methylobacterium sp. C1 TaxID=1479019 RepID=UPI0008DA05FC|nr:hypothetical protein [Methylobacterium sp. C1]